MIVEAFNDEILPYAKELITNLIDSFWSSVKAFEELQNEDAEESTEKSELLDAIESSLRATTDIISLDIS